MSYYEALPIYRSAMDLNVHLDGVVRGFSRFHKYTLGVRLRDKALSVLTLVPQANRASTRFEVVSRICDQVEELKVLVNFGKEVQAFGSFEKSMQVMEKVVALARQAEGWRKSAQPAGVPSRPRPQGPEPGIGAGASR
jgi:hypothetical protein